MLAEPKIITLKDKKLVGHSIEMSLVDNKTFELFSGFMPKRKQIENAIGSDIYEVLIYDSEHFKSFKPTNTFTKLAMVEVSEYDTITVGMKNLNLKTGSYAVFRHIGLVEEFSKLMQYIFTQWLPQSEYVLDNRPHFNILVDKYKNGSPDSEEDVYVPVKLKC